MPVGYTNRTFDPGNFGVGSLATLAAKLFTRGGGGGQPNAPITGEMLQGAFGIPAATTAPPRNYLGGDVSAAHELVKSLTPQPPPPLLPQMAGGPPVPMSRPVAQAGYIGGGRINGPGDGRSDSVPAMVDGQGVAQLSSDEYVVPADVVSALGRGSSAAGAKRLDAAWQQVRTGYANELKGMKAPKAGGKKKFLGGLFDQKQESQMELPDYLRGIAGSVQGSFQNFQRNRPSAVSEIAKFTPDQQAYFERARQAAGDPTGAQAAYQRGQDLLGGIYQGGDPWSDKLIQASLQDYDRGTQINEAAQRRSVAGRGAFGEGSQLAQVEAGQEAARGRGLLGEQLREQGLSRRTQAAQQIGALAGQEREANIGDLNLLGGIGQIEYGRAQQVAQAPFDRLQRINSLVQGAPMSTTATTSESPLKLLLGTAALGAGAFMKSGGRVREGGRASHRKRGQDMLYAKGGMVKRGNKTCEHLYADGGMVAPGAFKRLDEGVAGPEAFFSGIDRRNEMFDRLQAQREAAQGPGGVGDWFQRYVMSSTDPMAEAGKQFRGQVDPTAINDALHSGQPRPKTPAQRVAELMSPVSDAIAAPAPAAAPARAIPIPVSKPARAAAAVAKVAKALAAPVAPAPGLGALPARLASPEPPITAPPLAQVATSASGIRATEAPPPPPPADAPAGEKQNWLERWGTNPLTQFGFALMASRNPNIGGAIGEAGQQAIAGLAAGRREAREQQRVAQQDQRLQQADDRANRAEQLALEKMGIERETAANVVADRAEQRKISYARLGIEQSKADADARYKDARLGQLSQGLGIRREAAKRAADAAAKPPVAAKSPAAAKAAAAADPDKIVRESLQRDLAKAMGPDGSPEDAALIRQQLATLTGAVPPPGEGFVIDKGT